ncbi:MAG TPA: hypothetical protein VE172_20470 [Stackebrandtia sp.]|uniref:hypothetical protein n=1 Tax=Stackebrandtia sp. TaxID=2023065 RepID=UPI002D47C2A2|nr:hypothetical protein [Stackebrandtia sp.]HZE41181.1 hypothetical protein [Stackebrandtia sp.]
MADQVKTAVHGDQFSRLWVEWRRFRTSFPGSYRWRRSSCIAIAPNRRKGLIVAALMVAVVVVALASSF